MRILECGEGRASSIETLIRQGIGRGGSTGFLKDKDLQTDMRQCVSLILFHF